MLKGELKRKRDRFFRRWFAPDYNGGTAHFQIKLLTKDISVFVLIPLGAVFFFKVAEGITVGSSHQKKSIVQSGIGGDGKLSSQIIRFTTSHSGIGFEKRSVGTLVRVRLLNAVETLEGASAHVQIVDASLGNRFLGGELFGDVAGDDSTERIQISFHFARDPKNAGVGIPISARAVSLDGTAGLSASKKEGFFARSALRAGPENSPKSDAGGSKDFKTMIAHAVAAGMLEEFKDDASVGSKRAHVLTLTPGLEFYAELTDGFPTSH